MSQRHADGHTADSYIADDRTLVAVHGVGLAYGTHSVLDDVSLTLEPGRITTLIGPNGAGKSTLARLVLGLARPDRGRVERRAGLRIGYMPQHLQVDESLPLTPGEWPEWGNPITDKAAFEYIRSYSPYDNVTAQAYPPMMITGGLNDPRVTYWEPAKWTAKLRATKTDENILLLKTNMGAGHGGKSGRWNALEETAEEFAFLLWQMGIAG